LGACNAALEGPLFHGIIQGIARHETLPVVGGWEEPRDEDCGGRAALQAASEPEKMQPSADETNKKRGAAFAVPLHSLRLVDCLRIVDLSG